MSDEDGPRLAARDHAHEDRDPDCLPHAQTLYHSVHAILLALDQGTTSSRALLFDERATLLGMAREEHPQSYPQPGWVEHDPELLWQTQLRTARQVLAEARVSSHEVAAIGITDQRETTLLWERRAAGRSRMPSSGRTAARPDTASASGRRGSSP